jgi:hypothetical protein
MKIRAVTIRSAVLERRLDDKFASDHTTGANRLKKEKPARTPNYLVQIWEKITHSAGINYIMGNSWNIRTHYFRKNQYLVIVSPFFFLKHKYRLVVQSS